MNVQRTFIHPKSGEHYFVKPPNLEPQNCHDAVKKVAEQCFGWRLPAINELEAIYIQLHQKKPMAFEKTIYWSATEFNNTVAWYFDFGKGMDGTAIKKLGAEVIVIKEVS